MTWDEPSHKNGIAMSVFALFMVTIFTVVPWLIFKMIEQAIVDLRRWLKPTRIKPVVQQLLDNRVPSGRIGSNGSLRIGK